MQQALHLLPQVWLVNLSVLLRDYFGYIYLPLFALGLYGYFKQPIQQSRWHCIHFQWLMIASLALVVLPLVIADHASPHYYFLGAVFPALAVFSVYGVVQLNAICKNTLAGKAFIALLLTAMLVITYHNLHKGYQTERELSLLLKQRASLLTQIPANALIITEGANPAHLYILQRKGWWLDDDLLFEGKSIAQLHAQDAQFLLKPPKWQGDKLIHGYTLHKL